MENKMSGLDEKNGISLDNSHARCDIVGNFDVDFVNEDDELFIRRQKQFFVWRSIYELNTSKTVNISNLDMRVRLGMYLKYEQFCFVDQKLKVK